jgi:hypothetical protein
MDSIGDAITWVSANWEGRTDFLPGIEMLRAASDGLADASDALGGMEKFPFGFFPDEQLAAMWVILDDELGMWRDEKPIRRDPDEAKKMTILETVVTELENEIRRRRIDFHDLIGYL